MTLGSRAGLRTRSAGLRHGFALVLALVALGLVHRSVA
jgi:hypothetical protein